MCNEYIGVPGDVRMTMLILDIDFEESLCYLSEGAFLHAIFFSSSVLFLLVLGIEIQILRQLTRFSNLKF